MGRIVLTCPRCGAETRLLKLGSHGVVCDKCTPSIKTIPAGGVRLLSGNKYYPKMTDIMRQNITTRRVREDGKSRPDPRFRDSYERGGG